LVKKRAADYAAHLLYSVISLHASLLIAQCNTAILPSHIYSNAGWYSPIITLIDAQGTTHTAQTILLVQDAN